MQLVHTHVKRSEKHAQMLKDTMERFGFDIETEEVETSTTTSQNPKKRPRGDEDGAMEQEEEELDDGLPTLVHPRVEPATSTTSSSSSTTASSNVGMKMLQKLGYQGGKLGRNAK